MVTGRQASSLAKNTQAMHRVTKYLLKAVVAVIIFTIPMSIAWDAFFPGRIYFCRDEVGFGYFQPGNWVHGEPEVVDDVASASSRTMSDSDVILRGWTTERLWKIWSMMFGASGILAVLIARLRWLPRPQRPS